MYEVAQEEAQLRLLSSQQVADDKQQAAINDKYQSLKQRKFDNTLNLIKNLGDTVTASQALSLPKTVFGFDFNDGHVGLGGLTSAVIACYQLN